MIILGGLLNIAVSRKISYPSCHINILQIRYTGPGITLIFSKYFKLDDGMPLQAKMIDLAL